MLIFAVVYGLFSKGWEVSPVGMMVAGAKFGDGAPATCNQPSTFKERLPMNNTNIGEIWNDITDPKVDLKFLNDFIRNGIGLGLAWAIGINSFDNAIKPIEKYSACIILIITMTLFILNIFQFMFGIVKVIKSVENSNYKKFIKWISLMIGIIIGALTYIAITMILVGNSQLVLQKFTPSINGQSTQTNFCVTNL
jgi:hypothetical protein